MTTINTQRLLAYAYVSNIEYGIDKISNGEWAFTSIWKLSSLIVLVNCGRNWPEDFVKENNDNCIQTALNYIYSKNMYALHGFLCSITVSWYIAI